MTFRLVALMSVVLLLSLGAFGLMMAHYQDQVMAEVAQTASEVGRATLRTLEFEEGKFHFDTDGEARNVVMGWHARSAADGGEAETHGELKVTDASEPQIEVVDFKSAPGQRVLRRMKERQDVETGMQFVTIEQVSSALPVMQELVVTCEDEQGEAGALENCPGVIEPGELHQRTRVFISVEGVRAESDPAGGMVLKIPRFKPGSAATVTADVLAVRKPEDEAPGGASPVVVDTPDEPHLVADNRFEEVQLPIPMQEYQDLFATVRDRSLFVFFGVFLVGTALTAGVASRFTRPIRRLDSGIRRLSEGDLAVQVDVRGKDEVARLGRAFNEMTRSLRANRQRSRELTRREKLSALGRLAAGVAHDVRNPLHSIGLTLQHMRETCRPEADERAGEFDRSLEIIRGEVRRLDQLVGNFLRFARSDRREQRPVDLVALLGETARLVKKEAEWRNVEVVLDVHEPLPRLHGNGEAIRSSILNLVLNSFEAMPDGGRLTLGARSGVGEILVDVADTGEGIPEKDREHVFEFAFTTREGGHGLGLAMVHQCVVEEHGGRVGVESRVGEGTRVRMGFPVGGAETSEEA